MIRSGSARGRDGDFSVKRDKKAGILRFAGDMAAQWQPPGTVHELSASRPTFGLRPRGDQLQKNGASERPMSQTPLGATGGLARTQFPRVVIVGAGFGGLAAARGLKDSPVQVTLIDEQNHHLFQPLLYQVATAAVSPADVAVPIRLLFRGSGNVAVVMDGITGLDTAARAVLSEERRYEYDTLVLATGSQYAYFGREDWRARTLSLKTLDDALIMREHILLAFERAEMEADEAERRRLMTFVVIGGGPTGVELAGAIAELAKSALARDFRHIVPGEAEIVLLEAGTRLLHGFPTPLTDFAQRALERKGVSRNDRARHLRRGGDRGFRSRYHSDGNHSLGRRYAGRRDRRLAWRRYGQYGTNQGRRRSVGPRTPGNHRDRRRGVLPTRRRPAASGGRARRQAARGLRRPIDQGARRQRGSAEAVPLSG